MRSNLILFIIILLIATACELKPKEISGTPANATEILGSWRLADITPTPHSQPGRKDPLLEEAEQKELIQQGMQLSFFPDKKYTKVLGTGTYETGEWSFLKGRKFIVLKSGLTIDTIALELSEIKQLPVLDLQNLVPGQPTRFANKLVPLANSHEDPFYPGNNLWRIKPLQGEDSTQITQRLANYIRHYVYILKSTKERKSPVVSFEFSQGIVKIYNGGIGIQPKKLVPESWLNCFYSADEAWIAYDIFSKYLASTSYRGAGTGEWITDDYNILLAIYGDISRAN